MPKIHFTDLEQLDDVEQFSRISRADHSATGRIRTYSPPERKTQTEEFKCSSCKTFVGPPVSGGKHRNHCPLCLHSKHVDRSRPGDRLSQCQSLMKAVALYYRRNGEQVIVHICLGCGVERHCRVAADDSPVTLMRLPLTRAHQDTNSTSESDGNVA